MPRFSPSERGPGSCGARTDKGGPRWRDPAREAAACAVCREGALEWGGATCVRAAEMPGRM